MVVMSNIIGISGCIFALIYLIHFAEGLSVGVLLGDYPSQEQRFLNNTISRKYSKGELAFSANVQHVSVIDSYGASLTLCNVLRSGLGVAAIFGPKYTPATTILESICLEYAIPYISTSFRPIPVKDYGFFMNFFPETDYFAKALSQIIQSFGWRSFVVVYETDDALLKLKDIMKFQKYSEHNKKNKINFEKLGPGPNYTSTFEKIQTLGTTNIILDCQVDLILNILEQAKEANMLNVYDSYFLTNLDAHTLDYTDLNSTANITTIRLFNDNDEYFKQSVRKTGLAELIHYRKLKTETALFYDALWYLHDTIKLMGVSIFTTPISCNGTQKFRRGMELSLSMKNRLPTSGLTGPIQFDDKGNRIDFNIYVIDVLHDKCIATWYETNQSLTVHSLTEETVAVVTNLQNTKITVASRLGKPFLMLREPEDGSELTGNARYEGFSLDLIAGIAKIVGFEFEISLVEDGMYGSYNEEEEKWTGLIGDILSKKAHLAIADLTITQEREEVVDFSFPFMTLGISVLYRTPNYGETETFAVLNPFSHSVWMSIVYAYICISLVLYIILRLSPDDWEVKYPCDETNDTMKNYWNLKTCLTVAFKGLTAQSNDVLPKGGSARLAISVWWMFCLFISCSYVANLALMVNQANLEETIQSVEDLATQTKIKYGCVENGATANFLESANSTIYQKMWTTLEQSPSLFAANNQEGTQRVLESQNGLYAFLMESTQIEYEIHRNCELKQVGGYLDSRSFGIAMPTDAPYRGAINRAILKLQEEGTIADIKRKWWIERNQNEDESESCEEQTPVSTEELSIQHVRGLFIILGVGLGVAFTVALLEFLWNVKKIAKREKVDYCDALSDELKFASYIWTNRRKISN
ncbi:glutamate receptor ionotropic, kainate 2-like isoform X1 [Diorhabda sublineata]|uniref:glutamate receptor ionotropic, kainate 2-like isoform X1 n=1 Tax=Diorhabda sublineata TaxID=1163346 RepID=UPI0024E0E37F|nr:glutamate receptor ionotropic, kainate 2-like isoform X1 [Diorhabda sublineata]